MSDAYDLSHLAQQNNDASKLAGQVPGRSQAGADTPQGVATVELTEQNFQEIIQKSVEYPLVIDFWASWCEPCKQLKPVLLKIAAEYAGKFLLATVDIDAQAAIASAFQVQSVPTVMGVISGRPVPLFAGAQPLEQVRGVIDQLLEVAVQAGVTGQAPVAAQPEQDLTEPEENPEYAQAQAAEAAGDLDTAVEEWLTVTKKHPKDQEALAALARVRIQQRAKQSQERTTPETPAELADQFMAAGNAATAFDILLKAIKDTSDPDEREVLRQQIVEAMRASDDATAVRQARARLSALLLV